MSRLDVGPEDRVTAAECTGPMAVILQAREVPLGGVRNMHVRRTLPQRDLPMVGAWCFLDRFGPQPTRMRVEPHPHIGLQTVTWPLLGEVRHRDTIGSDVVVTRGALNLMTSGHGIAHSEYSLGEEEIPLDALQLWVALPESARHMAPAFEQHTELPRLSAPGLEALVVMGEFGGVTSPATAHTPIVGAEVRIAAGATVRLPLHAHWEYALLGVVGTIEVATGETSTESNIDSNTDSSTDVATGTRVDDEALLYLGIGREHIDVYAPDGATVFLVGGEPFPEQIIMWWNFVGRTHEEIVAAREDWERDSPRFGRVPGHGDERIPAPPMPGVRLTTRQRRLGGQR